MRVPSLLTLILLPERAEPRPRRTAMRCSTSTKANGSVDFPDRPIDGYLISQLISARVDAAEILRELSLSSWRRDPTEHVSGIPGAVQCAGGYQS